MVYRVMLFYFAPLEGITNYIYRNTYSTYYKSVDKFFTPFLSANVAGAIAQKSQREISSENNMGINLVPQLLSNNSNTFNTVSQKLKDQGYGEVNLNLGCPSGTVTSKGRGSGQLKDLDALKIFFDEIFENQVIDISVKTRIGFTSPDEMEKILPIFNNYPIKELIVHPRVREDYYKGPINLDVFSDIVKESKSSVCYNGDLNSVEQIENIVKKFPSIDKIMIGRGLIANPGLIDEYKSGNKMDIATFKEFHDTILSQYSSILFGERNILFKMKDHWKIWKTSFPNNEREIKKILKVQTLKNYTNITDKILN